MVSSSGCQEHGGGRITTMCPGLRRFPMLQRASQLSPPKGAVRPAFPCDDLRKLRELGGLVCLWASGKVACCAFLHPYGRCWRASEIESRRPGGAGPSRPRWPRYQDWPFWSVE